MVTPEYAEEQLVVSTILYLHAHKKKTKHQRSIYFFRGQTRHCLVLLQKELCFNHI